jgi:GAF domain-containing protein
MSDKEYLIKDLRTLNQIAQLVNQAVDVKSALDDFLDLPVKLMGLETSWMFFREPDAADLWVGHRFQLAAHYQLPPALDISHSEAWNISCFCQDRCLKGGLNEVCNEVHCSRSTAASGDRRGSRIHASAPLRLGISVLGILNIAASDWDAFAQRSLSMLTTIVLGIGIVLERARLLDMLFERRLHEQSGVTHVLAKAIAR